MLSIILVSTLPYPASNLGDGCEELPTELCLVGVFMLCDLKYSITLPLQRKTESPIHCMYHRIQEGHSIYNEINLCATQSVASAYESLFKIKNGIFLSEIPSFT